MSATNEPRWGCGATAEAAPGFGAKLRWMREWSGMSQRELAEAAGLNYSHVSRLESGDREPSRDSVHRLADALQLTRGARYMLLSMAVGMTMDDLIAAIAVWPVEVCDAPEQAAA